VTYQALARKYRPQRFADMVGQEPVVRTLTNALAAGRVHHAYVLSGIRGIGKTSSARLLARALNCQRGPTPDPCGTCPACEEITASRSIDSIEIDAASNRGIDEVKGLIQSAQYSPSRDRHKVFIVDEFHMLTREAFNALLKTLEEPPAHVVFILATTELEKVPATILSRCLLLNFRPVGTAELRDHLLDVARREAVELEPAAAELVARKAGGSVRDAHSTLDRVIALAGASITRHAVAEVLGVVDTQVIRDLLRAALEGRGGDALDVVARVAADGADLHGFTDDVLAEARALLVARLVADPARVLGATPAEVAALQALAGLASAEDLQRIVDRLLEAGPRLRQAAEPRFVLEALVVRLCHLTRLEPLADVVRRLDAGGGSDGGPGVEPARAPAHAPVAPTPPAAAPPRPPAPGATLRGTSWRERATDAVAVPELAADVPEPSRFAPAAAAATRAAGEGPLESFRSGLAARLRGHVDLGVLRRQDDGLALVLPGGREESIAALEAQRFHLMAAAAAAFGRPAPVSLVVQDDLLTAASLPGELEGTEIAARRRLARAEASPIVRAVLTRFDGRIVGVEPPRQPGDGARA
jgi:DNA polymerase-3 subunit gamma/tau